MNVDVRIAITAKHLKQAGNWKLSSAARHATC